MAVFRHQGAWRAQVYIKGICIASRAGIPTKGEAQRWHDETKVKRLTAPPTKRWTFEDLTARFREWHLPSVGERTRELYELELRLRVEPHFRFLKLDEIDTPHLEAFKAKVTAALAPVTANSSLQFLSLLLKRAVKWKMLRESPYALEPIPEPLLAYRWWSERKDVTAFLEAARASRYYAFYLCALETGLRLGELLGLAKDDIDFERGVIHVHRQWTAKHRYASPKHNKERWVNFDAKGELARVLLEAATTSRHPEAVFTTRNGKRPIRMNVAHKYLRGVIKRAGVPSLSMHSLRHTFASWFMREVGDIWSLKEILGHSDIKTTQRYAHHARNRQLPTLVLSTAPTHFPHTKSEPGGVMNGNDLGKTEWGYTDSKSNFPQMAS